MKYAILPLLILLSGVAHADDLSADAIQHRIEDFAANTGTLAGATAVCNAKEADRIATCTNLIIKQWSTAKPEIMTLKFVEEYNYIFRSTAQKAMAVQQKNPPMSCDDLLDRERQDKIWEICRTATPSDSGATMSLPPVSIQ